MLPTFNSAPRKSTKQVIRFGGINFGENFIDGELLDCSGLSSDRFPCISQRRGRDIQSAYADPTALFAGEALAVVDGTNFLYNGAIRGAVTPGDKNFARINSKIVIFPDKKYYDIETGEFGSLDASLFCAPGSAVFGTNTITLNIDKYFLAKEETDLLSEENALTDAVTVYTTAAFNNTDGKFTMTTSTAKTYETLSANDLISKGDYEYWEVISAEAYDDGDITYIRFKYDKHYVDLDEENAPVPIVYSELDKIFSVGDGIEITGCTTTAGNNKSAVIRGINAATRTLTFDASIFTACTEAAGITISRNVPDFECICEHNNRLWGAEGKSIYASSLGDPKNFFVFDGISTDSWVQPVGSPGKFTGCARYSTAVIFFKENCFHKVLGNYPAEYSLYSYTSPGVQEGSEKSLVTINETLYFKGVNGVYSYSGNLPDLVSENFGTKRFDGASAGTDGQRYYVSMRDKSTGVWSMFVLDTTNGFWLKEDNTHALDFALLDGDLYYLDDDRNCIFKTGQDSTERIKWSATFCPFRENLFNKNRYSKLYFNLDLTDGGFVRVEVSVDGEPFYQEYVNFDSSKRSITVPVSTRRCNSFKVRISGEGPCTIRSLVREYFEGSEV